MSDDPEAHLRQQWPRTLDSPAQQGPEMPPGVQLRRSAADAVGLSTARWAADPYGRHEFRFWDGVAWTEHVADRGAPSSDPFPTIEVLYDTSDWPDEQFDRVRAALDVTGVRWYLDADDLVVDKAAEAFVDATILHVTGATPQPAATLPPPSPTEHPR